MLRKTLSNNIEMPVLDYGVFQAPPEETERYVTKTLGVDYRLIDTAQAYGNKEGVGAAVRASGIPREEAFITSKIWVASVGYERAVAPINESLRKLGTDYIDLMLLHRAMNDYPGAYRAMENAYKASKLHAIGVSNFYPERLVDMTPFTEIPPAINQVRTHPFHQQDAAHEVMTELDVAHEAWAPFTEGQNNIFINPVLTGIGREHGKKPGRMILWALMQRDVIVIPKMTRRNRMEESFDVFDFRLYAEDLVAFAVLDGGSLPCIFGHYDPKAVAQMLRNHVKGNQLDDGTLY